MDEGLCLVLRALSNENRLRLLEQLQRPRSSAELILPPSRGKVVDMPRAISRQALRRHLDALLEIGVIEKMDDQGPEPRYVLDHARLYYELERLRALSRLRGAPGASASVLRAPPFVAQPAEGPHLLLVRGAAEGRAFPLEASASGGWVLGRSPDAEVLLDYDPCVETEHARVTLRASRYKIEDLGTTNGTSLNSRRLAPHESASLRPGDVVGVGLSVLVFRA